MKRLIIFLTAAICSVSCSTTRFQPVQRDSTVVRYVDSLRIRDSVVMVSIPMESSSQIFFSPDTSHLETSVAESDAWTDEEGRIHHTLNNKSTEKLPAIVPVRDRARVRDEIQSIIVTQTVEVEKPLTWWQRFRLKGFWVLLGLASAWIAWKIIWYRIK